MPQDGDGGYRPTDVQRMRLVDAFERAGVAAEDLGRAIAIGVRSLYGPDVGLHDPPPSSGKFDLRPLGLNDHSRRGWPGSTAIRRELVDGAAEAGLPPTRAGIASARFLSGTVTTTAAR